MIGPAIFMGPHGEQFSTYVDRRHNELGKWMMDRDGRLYRFGRAGAANLAVGVCVQSAVPVANHLGLTPVTLAAVGTKDVTVTLGATAVAEDDYRDGYLVVEDGLGQGYRYKIVSHLAAASGAAVQIKLHPDERVKSAWDATTRVSLLRHQFDDVVVVPAAAAPTAPVVGVTVTPITADYYGWFLVEGETAILQQGALTVGRLVVHSATVAGAVMAWALTEGTPNTGHDTQKVGQVIRNAGDGNYAGIKVSLI